VITGTADHLEVRRAAEPSSNSVTGVHVGAVGHGNAHVGAVGHGNVHVGAVGHGNVHVGAPAKLDAAIVRTQAKEALVGLGWRPATANAAVAVASAALGTEATLERLIFEALRRCPRAGA
jgi:hypothetical protein